MVVAFGEDGDEWWWRLGRMVMSGGGVWGGW